MLSVSRSEAPFDVDAWRERKEWRFAIPVPRDQSNVKANEGPCNAHVLHLIFPSNTLIQFNLEVAKSPY